MNGIANSVDPDQTALQSDLGLHCLPRPICPKTHFAMNLFLLPIYFRAKALFTFFAILQFFGVVL